MKYGEGDTAVEKSPVPAKNAHAIQKEDVSITINVNDDIKNVVDACWRVCWMDIPKCPTGWVGRLDIRNCCNIANSRTSIPITKA
jgi:hypothetical protein